MAVTHVADGGPTTPCYFSLSTAVMEADLLPGLLGPFDTLTVFAPNNAAFDAAVIELNTDINGLLADTNLANILLYHVLAGEVSSASVNNGDIVNPLNPANSLKLTKKSNGDVFVNQAQVDLPDVGTFNGVIHGIDEVVLANQTVIDVALNANFTTLATAVIEAELLPNLSDPFEEFTVFAPTNEEFDTLASDLDLSLNDILELSDLGDILLYHVVEGTVLSNQLSNGPVATLNGNSVEINIDNGVMVNTAMVTLADQTADNGVVHVIDAVLQEPTSSVYEINVEELSFYPNPIQNEIRLNHVSQDATFTIYSISGAVVKTGIVNNAFINVSNLEAGSYIINVQETDKISRGTLIKL